MGQRWNTWIQHWRYSRGNEFDDEDHLSMEERREMDAIEKCRFEEEESILGEMDD